MTQKGLFLEESSTAARRKVLKRKEENALAEIREKSAHEHSMLYSYCITYVSFVLSFLLFFRLIVETMQEKE